ncbi:ATP-binding cassette sub-family B member 8, mitochondrial isoform X1 [Calypte anna]|uniref:ATP-binding cassette sub-family B member 8, mitochondrial isoform X1 n=1 Tax=Calypte anna TaxID=9244 RepID=UPI0011C4309D|nr:ATP-binding cassette sub-family B member 8, mitochondrial isoform X1 [Calypte anna]
MPLPLLRLLGLGARFRPVPLALRGSPGPGCSFRYGGICPGLVVPPCRPPCPPTPARLCLLLAGPLAGCALIEGVGLAARCQEATLSPVPVPEPSEHPQPSSEPPFDWPLFWTFLRPQLLALSAAVLLALFSALVSVRVPVVLGQLVDAVSGCAGGLFPHYVAAVHLPALRLLGLHCLQGLLTFGYIALLARAGERLAGNMRKELFMSLLRQDVAFFDATRTGQLVARLTADVQEFKSSFKLVISQVSWGGGQQNHPTQSLGPPPTLPIPQGLRSGTQTLGGFVSLYLLSPKLTGLLVLALPTLVGIGTLLGSGLRGLSRQAQEQVAKATVVADEALGNVRTVRAFAMEEQQAGLYCTEVDRAGLLSERLGLGIAAFQGLSSLALNAVVLGTIFVGGSLMAGDQLSPGDLMSFLVASQTVQRSMASISVLMGQVVRGLSAGARVLELLRLEPSVGLRGGGSIPHHSLLGHISFNHVSFSYPTRPGHPVLQDFSLTLPPGKTVAIVGPSGEGKSTVAALLERFYEPTRGTITLDGRDIAELDPSWLRGKVLGFISQEPVLFGTSILENIRFGRPGASDAEVESAARMANADGFIRAFPEGYHTLVGERGVALSGGQKQRVAIARALLKDPQVLILDEATSALDAESERAVQEALDRASHGRTVLVIAHRLSTVRGAHCIVVLARGRVAEAGTHEELVRRGGLYAELIRRQQQDGS